MRCDGTCRRGGCRGRGRLAVHEAAHGRNAVLTFLLLHELWDLVEGSPLEHGAFGNGSVGYFLVCCQDGLSGKALVASVMATFVGSFACVNTSAMM